MEAKNLLTLSDEFLLYCKINEIEDINAEAERVFNMGFAIVKYGTKPTKKLPPLPPPPPPRKIVEGKRPESPEEYHERWEKIKKEQKNLYDE